MSYDIGNSHPKQVKQAVKPFSEFMKELVDSMPIEQRIEFIQRFVSESRCDFVIHTGGFFENKPSALVKSPKSNAKGE